MAGGPAPGPASPPVLLQRNWQDNLLLVYCADDSPCLRVPGSTCPGAQCRAAVAFAGFPAGGQLRVRGGSPTTLGSASPYASDYLEDSTLLAVFADASSFTLPPQNLNFAPADLDQAGADRVLGLP